jgi:GH25 family lysozyme M1 (1,4-beta-N-acetylmuramidase)
MTALCLDVSNNRVISEADLKASGAALLICKATEGDGFKDATLAEHRRIAKKVGVRFGTYVFLHAASKNDEADFYLRYAKPEPGELVIIDSEPGGQDGKSIETMARRTDSCARELEARGHKPILYASSSYWTQLIVAVPALRRLRVWEAQYPGRSFHWLPGLGRLRVRLRHGVDVVLWQWTDSYKVGNAAYDASAILIPVDRL